MKITPRDREVLERLRLGFTNRQIAEELHCSERTVKQHLRMLFMRAGIPGDVAGKRIALVNLLSPAPINQERLRSLTPREREIAEQAIAGKSNAEIAAGQTTEQTIKNHLRSIYDKIGCGSKAELRYFVTA